MIRSILSFLYWILTIAPLIIAISIFPSLPEQVPAHYNVFGEVDRWGSKWEIFIIPITSVLLCGIFYPLMMLQMKKEKNSRHERALKIALLLLPVTLLLTFIMMSVVSFQSIENINELPFIKIIVIVTSLMFSALGFVIPNIKMNGWFGIRTPRTMSNEEVWRKTHIFGGKVWVIGGIAIAIIALFLGNDSSVFVLLGGLLLITIIPIIYSHRI